MNEVRERQHAISLMSNLRNKKEEKKTQTTIHILNYREQIDGYQKAGGSGNGLNRRWGLRSALVTMSTNT